MKKYFTLSLISLMMAGILFALPAEAGQRPELIKEIIKVRYISVREAYSVIFPYRSDFGKIQMLENRNLLIIEDQAEFVKKIKSILNDIDLKPVDIQFTVDLILASMEGGQDKGRPVSDSLITELKNTLKYQSFHYLDTSLIKVQDNGRASQRMAGDGISFQLSLQPRFIAEEGDGMFQIHLSLMQYYGFKEDGSPRSLTLLNTSLSLKNKDRTVVGVSKLNGGDKALILIIKGEILN